VVEVLRANAGTGITLTGNSYSNTLYGGAGNDTLNAGSGNDTLYGGAGNDTLKGGSGSDTFVIGSASGKDTITDFQAGTDRIDVSAYHFASFSDLLKATKDVGFNTVISLDATNSLTLTGLHYAQLHASDFIL